MASLAGSASTSSVEAGELSWISFLLNYADCPDEITGLLLQSEIPRAESDAKVGARWLLQSMVTEEIFEQERFDQENGTWGSEKNHFVGAEGLQRWFSPLKGSSQKLTDVLPSLNAQGESDFVNLSAWHIDRATCDVDICGWLYSSSFIGFEQFEQNESEMPTWSSERSVFSRVRRRRWVRLKCLSESLEACRTWLKEKMNGFKPSAPRRKVVEEVFENNRFFALYGFGGVGSLLATDPGLFTDREMLSSLNESPLGSKYPLDSGWNWSGEWEIAKVSDLETCQEGWLYAVNFPDYTSEWEGVPEARAFDYVRRRRWTRTREHSGPMPDEKIINVAQQLEEATMTVESMTQKLSITSPAKRADRTNSKGDIAECVTFWWERGQTAGQHNTWFELERKLVQSYFKVRSATYMRSKKKVQSDGPLAKLAACELFSTGSEKKLHLANRASGTFLEAARARGDESFYYVVGIITPSPPYTCLICYYEMPAASDMPPGFSKLWNQFLEGDDGFRNQRWKIIPRVEQGPWVVKSSVGTTPALLGMKVDQKYFRGDRYIEVDIDVGSSKVASMLTGLILASMKQLTIDLAFTLEGRDESELPEAIIGTLRMDCVDLSEAKQCDDCLWEGSA